MKKLILALALSYTLTTLNAPHIYFFKGTGCLHCAAKVAVLEDIKKQYPETKIEAFDIYKDQKHALRLTAYFDHHKIDLKKRGIPAVFFGDIVLIGNEITHKKLEKLIKKFTDAPYPERELPSTEPALTSISLATIISAALIDSINPCAIAVLLILLGALMLCGNRKRVLKAGLAFTASIYISYFLFGLGLFSALQVTHLAPWFFKAIGFIAIIIGLANLKDYFWYAGGGFVMEIPISWRPKLKKMLNNVTSPLGAFFIGFVVCLFELPCTGGPYIVILGLLAKQATRAQGIPLLLVYNVFFVIPLIITTLLIYSGFTTIEKAHEWKERNIRNIHLLTGIIMLIIGAILIVGII